MVLKEPLSLVDLKHIIQVYEGSQNLLVLSCLVIAKTVKDICPVNYLTLYLSAFSIPQNSYGFFFRKVSVLKDQMHAFQGNVIVSHTLEQQRLC